MEVTESKTPSSEATRKDTAAKTNILDLSRDELAEALRDIGVPERQVRMRTRQVWHWVYSRGVHDFEAMHNVAKDVRARLSTHFDIGRPAVASEQISEDGTRKWLVQFPDGRQAETVYIPDEDRGTLCVSSQVGCTLSCKFCHTGTQRLVRNLTAGEIVGQVMIARDSLGEWPSPTDGRLLSNIVMMGMGEPLYNFDNVKKALLTVMDGEGIALSRRRITLSTSGVVPEIHRCGAELGVNLAISLHAVRDAVRTSIMPLNKKYPLAELLAACRDYPGASNARRITFEYVMLKDVNDSIDDAKELVRLLRAYDIPAKVNLIPFNPWPGAPYERSDWRDIAAFSEYIYSAGISAPVRMPRGQDIMAACGQLKSASETLKKSARNNTAHASETAST